jgi:polysaccharide transporter, PST family
LLAKRNFILLKVNYSRSVQITGYLKRVKNSPVSLNAFFIFLTQVVNYGFPFLTVKYLVSLLGAENFGKIAFTQSFIGYFTILVDYGFSISTTQEIAVNKNNPEAVRRIFYNVYYAKLLLLLLSIIIYTISIGTFERFSEDSFFYISFFGSVIGFVLFPQWYFNGIEKMGYITLINAIIKVISLVCILIFIKSKSDYVYLPLLYSLSTILPGIYAFIIAKNKVGSPTIPKTKEIEKAFSNGFGMFISAVMAIIISGSAVFFLGFVADDAIIGYYSGFDRVAKAAYLILCPITLAIYPTVSRKFSESYEVGYNYIKKVGLVTVSLAVCVAIGLMVMSKFITNLLYTSDFLKYRIILYVLAVWIVIITINNFIGVQYLTSIGKSRLYGKAFVFAATIALPSTYVLIRLYSYTGAAFSVLLGESLLTFFMLILIFFTKRYKKNDFSYLP